jgi:enterobacteria phage integrase
MGGRDLRRLKYLHAFIDRHGKARYYFRRNGKRTPLPGSLGSQEFMDAYAACLAERLPVAPRRAAAAPGTFAALAMSYYGSPKYRDLAPSSRANYRRVIDGFLEEHGHRRVDQLRREHIDAIIGKMDDRPGAGIVLLKRIRTLVRYAISIKWLSHDPTLGATSYRSKEFHTWNEKELAQFEARWPEGSRQRLAYALLLYTGQRGSDVYRMSCGHIDGDTIEVAQQKTGQEDSDEKLVIPMHRNLRGELALAKREHLVILTTAFGQPFSLKGFGNFVSDAIQAAGLPARCKAHGLRKAAARRLAEAGCTVKQIQAITGHKSLEEVERYTRKADQMRLARQAVTMQEKDRES